MTKVAIVTDSCASIPERADCAGWHGAQSYTGLRMMVEKVEAVAGFMGKIKIAYVHATAVEEEEKIRAMVEERLPCVESIIAELSPALGVHTGPGTAGLCYFPVKA